MNTLLRYLILALLITGSVSAQKANPNICIRQHALASWSSVPCTVPASFTSSASGPLDTRQLTQPVQQQPAHPARTSPKNVSLSSQEIISDVYFNADKQSSYYVTDRFNLVKVARNKPEVIGRLAPLKNSGYPYMIFDENTRFLVDTQGNILTTNGRKIGFMNTRKSGNAHR